MSTVRLQRILVATDFSSCGTRALAYAAHLARHFGARLLVEHVVPVHVAAYAYAPAEALAAVAPLDLDFERVERERATDECNRHIERAGARDLAYEVHVQTGDAAETLREQIETLRPDLFVMGTHGWAGAKRALFGSTAQQLIHSAGVPVMTIGPGMLETTPEQISKGVLLATDFSMESEAALPLAASFAETFKTKLTLLHVAPDGTKSSIEETITRATAREQLTTFSHNLEHKLNAELEVGFGEPAEVIARAAQHQGLVVMGARGLGALGRMVSRFMGGTAIGVIREAPCPVLTVRLR